MKDVVQSFVKASEFDKKNLMKAGGYISRNVINITIKMKTIIRKPCYVTLVHFLIVRNS